MARYAKRISGPLLDRIDMHGDVSRMNYEKLTSERLAEDSATIRERVTAARTIQADCFAQRAPGTKLFTNADMGAAEV